MMSIGYIFCDTPDKEILTNCGQSISIEMGKIRPNERIAGIVSDQEESIKFIRSVSVKNVYYCQIG